MGYWMIAAIATVVVIVGDSLDVRITGAIMTVWAASVLIIHKTRKQDRRGASYWYD
jgi:hypothetical protein